MKTKILISGLILCSFFMASMNVVIAYTSDPITDPTGDVYDYINGVNVTTKPHIDIKELVCSRDYRKVTLKLTLEGSVKNQGDVRLLDPDYILELEEKIANGEITYEEIEELYLQTSTSYLIELETSIDSYLVYYVNKDVLVFDGNFSKLEASSQVNNNILTISFNLPSSQENLTYVSAYTAEGSLFLDADFSDDIFGEELNDVLTTNGNNDNGSNGGQDGSGFTIFIVLIVIVVIAGIAVVVFIIRR